MIGQVSQHLELPVDQSDYQPFRQQSLTVSRGPVSVSIQSGKPYTFSSEYEGKHSTLSLPDTLAQVDTLNIYEDKRAVIVGRANGTAYVVIVVDIPSKAVEDVFYCYAPSISPNAQYVAFIKFFPGHGVEGAEDHYMLYDVRLSANENRPPGANSNPQTVVGRTVYPRGIANVDGDNIDIEARPLHQFASDMFFWNTQSTDLVFADQFDNKYTIVSVNFRATVWAVWSTALAGSALCNAKSLSCFEKLSSVNFSATPESPVTLGFRGVLGTPPTPVRIRLDNFNTNQMSASVVNSKGSETLKHF